MKRLLGLVLLLAWCVVPMTPTTSADVRLPAIVGDNMMLQQQMGAPIWGRANPGETVTVAGSWGKQASTAADDNGKWKVCLDTPSHGGPYTLTIKGKNEITINNVMIGEVWLCAGQSNMQRNFMKGSRKLPPEQWPLRKGPDQAFLPAEGKSYENIRHGIFQTQIHHIANSYSSGYSDSSSTQPR